MSLILQALKLGMKGFLKRELNNNERADIWLLCAVEFHPNLYHYSEASVQMSICSFLKTVFCNRTVYIPLKT